MLTHAILSNTVQKHLWIKKNQTAENVDDYVSHGCHCLDLIAIGAIRKRKKRSRLLH